MGVLSERAAPLVAKRSVIGCHASSGGGGGLGLGEGKRRARRWRRWLLSEPLSQCAANGEGDELLAIGTAPALPDRDHPWLLHHEAVR